MSWNIGAGQNNGWDIGAAQDSGAAPPAPTENGTALMGFAFIYLADDPPELDGYQQAKYRSPTGSLFDG